MSASTITAGIAAPTSGAVRIPTVIWFALIEGRITVMHPQAEPVLMSEPLSFYVAPWGHAPQPVAAVAPDQLAKWAQETEIQPRAATFRKNGQWAVHLGVVGSEDEALALYDRVRAAGYRCGFVRRRRAMGVPLCIAGAAKSHRAAMPELRRAEICVWSWGWRRRGCLPGRWRRAPIKRAQALNQVLN